MKPELHFINFFKKRSRNSSVSIDTILRPGGRDSVPDGLNDGLFSPRYRVQTGSGAHPTSYPVATRGFSPGVKRPVRETDQSLPSGAEVKNAFSYISAPSIRLHDVVLN